MAIRFKVLDIIKKNIDLNAIPYQMREEPFVYGFPDTKKIRSLKGKFAGKRCFILGNGPSLNKVDLSLLKNEYSFAVNGIFYKTDECGYRPTFYVVEDKAVMADNIERINEYEAPYKFFPINYRSKVKNRKNCLFFRMNTGFYKECSPNYGVPRFSTDASRRLYCGQSVTMINLQLAHYLGFSEVYLIGMDFNYEIPKSAVVNGKEILSTEDDCNHFHPEYFGKGKTWHDPQLDKVLNSYKMMKIVYEASNRRIFNATVGGKLEVFERVDFDSLF
ncbi:6-hydroxymethylpterin diphosphokinase MptE-like protein [Gallaecimonas xiamenensis]|uniref:6-hydroxymethylpterin diphosphokinase MptE-like domain-containing protein n=1 Tax=Gallaecimonas xiamenensis 3-C-1 TaxID=745411 RepID=K2KDH9_9GAMM|nr:6-hydroxymethylpterin diphosphokinase MptE-like protein [Gallaecimonas xiamenensis]EKE75365.1 hypothetical protein B3C1_06804 [Gallaecimonas xiamenensis 3-C-1]